MKTNPAGPWSLKLRAYHQSSHLGDEFLLRFSPERVNLSYEAVSALLSWEGEFWRFYGGGEYLLRKEPSDIDPVGLQWGIELRGPRTLPVGGRFLAGLDCKSRQENHWNLSVSLKAGFEFDPGAPGGRSLRLLGLVYEGYSPHGQYYMDRIAFYGVSLAFGF